MGSLNTARRYQQWRLTGDDPRHLTASEMINLFLLTLLALAAADSKILEPRIEKSLVNTFPFDVNEGEHDHDHHDGHHDHHGHDENQKTSSSLVKDCNPSEER